MNLKNGLIISLLILIMPFFVLAADTIRPGTDDYLITNGLTETQLTNQVATENREPFISAVGEKTISDPLGDVVSRWGTRPGLNYGWGDINQVSLKKDQEKSCWQFDLIMAEEIPKDKLSLQVNYLLYIDSDDNLENNANQGIRVNTDYEVSVKYSVSNQEKKEWYTDLRWYNKEADFWAINKTTASAFEINGNVVSICVPFQEVAETIIPNWRAAAAISDETNTQFDVTPGAGFPPPKGETYPTWSSSVSQEPTSTNSMALLNWKALIVVSTLVGLAIGIKLIFWLINKKRNQIK